MPALPLDNREKTFRAGYRARFGDAPVDRAIEWVLALSAFWLTKVSALNNLYFSVQLFLGGGFAPLAVMPAAFAVVAQWAPFSWSLAFPAEVAMGRRTGLDILYGSAMQVGWIIVASIVLRLVWSRALRHYSAVGA